MKLFIIGFVLLLVNNIADTQVNITNGEGNLTDIPDEFSCSPVFCGKNHEPGRLCSCREDCYLYNECCADKVNQNIGDKRDRYPSIYYSCIRINQKYFYQFDRCPPYANAAEYVNSCENPSDNDQLRDVPAFGKGSKKLYKNIYCALCHGEEEYVLWKLSYNCFFRYRTPNVTRDVFLDLLKNGSCHPQKKIPSDEYSPYAYPCVHYISRCDKHNENETLKNMCETEPMRIVSDGSVKYRNIHCAKCNGIEISRISCTVLFTLTSHDGPDLVSLTVIFNPNSQSIIIENSGSTNNNTIIKLPACPEHKLYDVYTRSCQQITYYPPLNCTTTTLNESEYYITRDGYLYINNTQTLLNQSEFRQDSQGIINICVKNGMEIFPKYIMVSSYIMLVGLMLSVPAMGITIVIYLCIPELRTLPGKLLLYLLSALFIAELLLLIGIIVTPGTLECTCIAVTMHYLFLAAFFWMNVISFDAWYTFSGCIQHGQRGKGSKRLLLYSLYAWITPFLIVTSCFILDFIPGEQILSPKYGQYICWIGNDASLWWFFALPVIIILCINILAFIFTARGLHASSKHSSKYLSRHNKYEFVIYIKLCFIMGLTWMFAFLYDVTKIDEFFPLSSIFLSFQGVFICLSFLLTKVVWRGIRKRFQSISLWSINKSMEIPSSSQGTLSTQIKHL